LNQFEACFDMISDNSDRLSKSKFVKNLPKLYQVNMTPPKVAGNQAIDPSESPNYQLYLNLITSNSKLEDEVGSVDSFLAVSHGARDLVTGKGKADVVTIVKKPARSKLAQSHIPSKEGTDTASTTDNTEKPEGGTVNVESVETPAVVESKKESVDKPDVVESKKESIETPDVVESKKESVETPDVVETKIESAETPDVVELKKESDIEELKAPKTDNPEESIIEEEPKPSNIVETQIHNEEKTDKFIKKEDSPSIEPIENQNSERKVEKANSHSDNLNSSKKSENSVNLSLELTTPTTVNQTKSEILLSASHNAAAPKNLANRTQARSANTLTRSASTNRRSVQSAAGVARTISMRKAPNLKRPTPEIKAVPEQIESEDWLKSIQEQKQKTAEVSKESKEDNSKWKSQLKK
jgi:hypothetical protein